MDVATVLAISMTIANALLAAFWFWREKLHDAERQDLLNRVMAGNYSDYQRYMDKNGRPPPKTTSGVKKALLANNPAHRALQGGDDG
jgi:hypothetical protein